LVSRIVRNIAYPVLNSLLCNPGKKKIEMKNIFVGNLSFGTTEDDIRAMFESHGTVDRVNVVTDRDTGRARGFAFVEMANDAEGDAAIAALNGRELDGRALNINEARPKESRGGSGGGGGRGRGGSGGGFRSNNRW
jgi:cold-inducible RNA-binding protein